MRDNSRSTGGIILGGALGGYGGSLIGDESILVIVGGALIGALVGYEIGNKLDKVDAMYSNQAQRIMLNTNLPIGKTIYWRNLQTGNYGSYTAVREGRNKDSNEFCKEYNVTTVIKGQRKDTYDIACLQPNGIWRVVHG